MKNLKYIILTFSVLAFAFYGCKTEYIPPTGPFADGIASKTGRDIIALGDTVGFVDISQGVSNRVWTLPEGSRFVEIKEGENPASAQIINIEFNQPGIQEINLKAEFTNGAEPYDTTFTVEVLDSITGKLEILDIQSSFIEQTPQQISIYEGGSITFVDSSTGDVNRRLWLLPGGNPEKAGDISQVEDAKVQEITVQYPTIGVFDVMLVSWREDPFAKKDTVFLEDYVNVLKNEEPPLVSSIAEVDNDSTLQITYNLPMKISGDVIPNFTLTVDGNPVAINSITVNPTNNQVIDIVPSIDIFHRASATLSYDGNGGLTRVNDVPAPAFSDAVVDLDLPDNVLAMAGIDVDFETNTNATGWDLLNFTPANANPLTNNSGVSAEYTNQGYNSTGSMVFHLNANEDLGTDEKNNLRFSSDYINFPVTLEAGKQYRLEFYYKVEGEGAQEMTWRYHSNTGWPPAHGGGWTSGATTEWKLRTITWNAPIDADVLDGRMSIQLISKTNNKKADIYIDDLLMYAID